MANKKINGINAGALAAMDEKEDAFTKSAVLAEKGNVNKGGRPTKEDKADKPMTVYFTESDREVVKKYCSQISFSSLVKQLLQEKGIL